MNNDIQIFKNKDFGELEILMINSKPYFPGVESATMLGYVKAHNAISRHCRDSLKRGVIDTMGREQEKIFIPEGDLYRLIVRSKLPTALKFEEWVFDEVLPSIRKHGAYITGDTLDDLLNNPDTAIRLFTMLKEEREKKAALEKQIEEISPKARYYDVILQCKNAIPMTVIAKDYGMSANALNKLLYDLKVQYKVDGIWVLYQKHSNQNYTVTQTHYVNDDKLAIPHDNAEKYLRDVLQERFDIKKLPPITKWQAEREKLTAVKKRLDVEYSKLRTETAAVEKIKRNIDDILNEGTGTPQRTKKHGIEL